MSSSSSRHAVGLSSSGRRHIVVMPSSPSSYRPVVIFHVPLYIVHVFTLYTPHCTLHFRLDIPHSTLYTPSALYTSHVTLYTFTLHTLHFHSALYTSLFTLRTIHFKLDTAHSTLDTLHSTLTLYIHVPLYT